MFFKYIPAFIFMLCLLPSQANAGDLEAVTNALENLADMSRSADDAHEAMRNAINGNPSRYYRDYDRRYYYDDDYPRDRYYDHRAWKAEKEHAKAMRKQAKKWRKHQEKVWRDHHEHEWHKHHPRPYYGEHQRPGPPPFARHFW